MRISVFQKHRGPRLSHTNNAPNDTDADSVNNLDNEVNLLFSKKNMNTLVSDLLNHKLFNGMSVTFLENRSCTEGSTDFDTNEIKIGISEWDFDMQLSNSRVLVSTLVTLFHERQHVVQNNDVMNGNANDDMVLSHLVDSNNKFYYLFNYKRAPRELDAEFSGVGMTYQYMTDNLGIKEDKAFSMIKDYIEFKKDHSNFYDGVNYKAAKSMEELYNMFDVKYESAQRDHDPYDEIYRKPERIYVRTGLFKKEPKDVIRHIPNTDIAFKYMNEHPDIKALFGTFDGVKGIRDRNKIMAAITLELKPELRNKYKDYKCVQNLHLDEVCYEFAPDKFKKPEPRNVVRSVETNLRSSKFNYIAMNDDCACDKDGPDIV